jgi:hypothetical protein
MTERLHTSIEHLYEAFAKYQALSKLEGSHIYDDLEMWRKGLRSKKLRELTADDLSLFAGKVLLTWGDEDDLRYYLPRILELSAQLQTPYDIWILYNRLEDANWRAWEPNEQAALKECTLAIWENLLQDDSEKAEWEFKEYFHAIAYYYPDFSEIISIWETNSSSASTKHLVQYIFDEKQYVFDKNCINSREKNTKNIAEFRRWLLSDTVKDKIEKALSIPGTDKLTEKIKWVEYILSVEREHQHSEI